MVRLRKLYFRQRKKLAYKVCTRVETRTHAEISVDILNEGLKMIGGVEEIMAASVTFEAALVRLEDPSIRAVVAALPDHSR